MSYIKKNFLLENKTAEKLYFEYAKDMPIFDYHCHLSEKQILEDKQFEDIFDVWLSGDHYKWRLMRNYGIDESYITGNKTTNKEKFMAYCETLETAFLNPLYHWSQLELEMYFHCNLEINKKNAPKIWQQCNKYIKTHKITPSKLIINSGVKHIFTTNEPFDSLATFEKLKEKFHQFTVAPAFRCDKIININSLDFNRIIDRLNPEIKTIKDLEKELEKRLKKFIKVGCVASDMAIEAIRPLTNSILANRVFENKRNRKAISKQDVDIYKGYIVYFLLKLYAKYNIRSEIHLGSARNNNTKAFLALGADTGFDSISDASSLINLSSLLDKLNYTDSLPPIILFNLNSKMNLELITLMNSFQDSSLHGKIQYGPSWWFLDHKEGIMNHFKDLSSVGHLGVFIGMLTDSRSFLSYARHHYFRRLLCNYLGSAMERGEITNDIKLVGKVVKDISYNNAIEYFAIKK